jgi:hypothetical protein
MAANEITTLTNGTNFASDFSRVTAGGVSVNFFPSLEPEIAGSVPVGLEPVNQRKGGPPARQVGTRDEITGSTRRGRNGKIVSAL